MEGGGTQMPHLMDSLAAVYQGEGDYERFKSRPQREPLEYMDRLYFAIRPTETLLGVLVERYGERSWVVGTDPQAKEKILQSLSQLLAQVDDEENFQKNTHIQNVAPLYR